VLGLGALVAADAQAERSRSLDGVQPAESEVVLRMEGDRVFMSEKGGVFRELSLGDTREAAELRRLVKQAGEERIAVPVGSFVVANGGANAGGVKPKDAADTPMSAKKGKSKRKRASHTHG
jgi:hypothetical protein